MQKLQPFFLPIAVILTIILWASAFVGIRAALTSYSPAHLALMRFCIASFVFLIYALIRQVPYPKLRDIPAIALSGLTGITLYNLTLNIGEQTITAGAASLLIGTAPIWTRILATIFLGEHSSWQSWFGIGVSFAGVAVIALGEGGHMQISPGVGFILLAAIAQAVYFVISKSYLQRYSPVDFTIYTIVSGSLLLLPALPGLWETVSSAPIHANLAALYLGIFPAAIAYFTWSYVLAHIPVSKATSFLYAIPVTAIAIAYLWLGEMPCFTSLMGGLLASLGVMLVNIQRHKSVGESP